MDIARAAALAPALAFAALVGCGGSERIDRAQYLHQADASCAATQTRALAGGQPLSLDALGRRLDASHAALRDGARGLHELRERLGDPVPAAIARFDRRVNSVVAAMRTLAADAELGDGAAVRKHAERLRTRAASLYEAARAAGLKVCGRGGNRAADRALFVAYRTQYLVHRDYMELNNGLIQRELEGRAGAAAFTRAFGELMQRLGWFRDDLADLAPPRELVAAHRAVQRRTSATLRSGRAVRAAIPRLRNADGAVIAIADRFDADLARLGAADARLRRLLSAKAPADSASQRS
jgi:hypothetical protein